MIGIIREVYNRVVKTCRNFARRPYVRHAYRSFHIDSNPINYFNGD